MVPVEVPVVVPVTVSMIVRDVVPRSFAHARLYSVLVAGDTAAVPDATRVPVQPPDARHVSAYSAFHIRVLVAPVAIVPGFAEKVSATGRAGVPLPSSQNAGSSMPYLSWSPAYRVHMRSSARASRSSIRCRARSIRASIRSCMRSNRRYVLSVVVACACTVCGSTEAHKATSRSATLVCIFMVGNAE